ncbi:hypothetical protein ACIQMR_31825 [Streptomyces sp. NPDC091376]|uniref:hypothetical protein n=1 Tax=Streptomyces sp. NPDC091376 TaxID=3365994 RepID=UPI00382C2CA4
MPENLCTASEWADLYTEESHNLLTAANSGGVTALNGHLLNHFLHYCVAVLNWREDQSFNVETFCEESASNVAGDDSPARIMLEAHNLDLNEVFHAYAHQFRVHRRTLLTWEAVQLVPSSGQAHLAKGFFTQPNFDGTLIKEIVEQMRTICKGNQVTTVDAASAWAWHFANELGEGALEFADWLDRVSINDKEIRRVRATIRALA